MNYLHLSYEPLDINAINQKVVSETCGAISMFCGVTRNNFDGKPVLCLEYEAYEPMALKQMQKICDGVRRKWPDIVHIAIYHRLGIVPMCEPSVIIAISSPHRQSSLNAVTVVIDKLKQHVPIWKKEKYANNESTWKENKECKKSRFNIEDNVIIDDNSRDVSVPKDFIQISAAEEEINRRIQCFVEKKRDEINLNNILDYTTTPASVIAATATTKRSHSDDEDDDDKNENNNAKNLMIDTCARTNSVVIKQEYSKCHLKVRRLENHHNHAGLQRSDYLQTLDKLMTTSQTQQNSDNITIKLENISNAIVAKCPAKEMHSAPSQKIAIYERLEAIEEHLNLPKLGHKEIIQRLKNIEDRLLYLESISPEYKHFLTQEPHKNSNNCNVHQKDSVKGKMRPTSRYHQPKKVWYTVNDIDNLIGRVQQHSSSFSTLSSANLPNANSSELS